VRGTLVTGMPRHLIASLSQIDGEHRAANVRSFGAVTSGFGGFPFMTPSR
jgi:hypothetical protein